MKYLLVMILLVVVVMNGCANNSDSKNGSESTNEVLEFTPYDPPTSTPITKRTNTDAAIII